jgi:hypothetical protein
LAVLVYIDFMISLAIASMMFHVAAVYIFAPFCLLALYLTGRLNPTRLWWLFSELMGERWKISYDVPHYPEDGQPDEQPINTKEINAGDLICTVNQHKDIESQLRQNPGQREQVDLKKWYVPVVVTLTSLQTGQITLGLLGQGQPCPEYSGPNYFRRKHSLSSPVGKRRKTNLVEEVAKSLTDLLYLLPSNMEQTREDHIVRDLEQLHNNDWSVRNAIRIARSAGLITRERTPRYAVAVDALKIFGSHAAIGGHPSCNIRLTELGRIWKSSESRSTGDYISDEAPSVGGVTLDIQIGDRFDNHGQAAQIGRKNVIRNSEVNQEWQGFGGFDLVKLAKELTALRNALKALATDPEHDLAIGNIASAQLAAENGDENAAMNHLAQLGRLAKWVIDAAKSISVGIAVAAINIALKNTPQH